MKKAKPAIIIASAILLAVVILQNTETVNTRVLFFTISMPRAVLLFVVAAIGFASGVFYSSYWRRRSAEQDRH